MRKRGSMKGFSIKSGDKRPTKKGAGMTAKGVAKYRRQNPGSKLQTAVTEKKPTGKRAARRKSYCARSAGQLKRSSAKTRNDPN